MNKKISALLTGFFVLSLISVVHAGFSMVPSGDDGRRQFNYELKPGESTQDSIVIQNNSETPVTLVLYGADATHSNEGSFALVNRTATQRTVGNWITFKNSNVTLAGGEKTEIPFTITMPTTVTPGNYAGGIAAETTAQPQNGSTGNTGAGVVISSRLVVKLFISVPGDINVKYNWAGFSHVVTADGKHRFSFDYSNQGNAAITVEPEIEISSIFGGNATEDVKLPGTILLQNEQVSVPYDWDQQPLFGLYTAKATSTFWQYDVANNQNIHPKIVTKTIVFWVIPWGIAAITLFIIALILIYVISKTIIIRRLKKISKNYEVQNGDTLVSIAQNAGIQWKKLAKINKLKAPYTLKKGDTIKVPYKK